jgi:peptidoglycan-associated lipoprotein
MKGFTIFLSLLFLLTASSYSFGQRKTFIRSADEAFDDQRYSVAIQKYQKAYTKVKKNPSERDRISFRMAECYRMTGDMKRALAQYKRLVKNNYDSKEPLILLHLADDMKAEGNYEEAKSYYEAFTKKMPDDPRGPNGVAACGMIQEWIDNPTKYEVKEEKKLNSKEADFATTYSSDNFNSLIFTSTREGAKGKKTDEWTDQKFSDLFTARMDRKDEWSTPTLLDNQDKDGVNTDANEGAPMMNDDFTTLYFTRCPNEDARKNGCQIYTAKRMGRTYSKPEILPLTLDSTEAIGQPTISKNELIIYFASDRKGGQGGKDIWVAFRKTKTEKFGHPQNLGPVVNTPGDEMFPFLRNDTLLYFASDGHPGMGGLDIFYTTPDTAGKWSKPVNIGTTINSTANDYAIIFQPDAERGYFSSDRNGRKSKDDIFSFIIPPIEFTLGGVVKDNLTFQFVDNAKVEIVGSDGVSMTAKTNSKGIYNFGKSQIMPNTTYEMFVSRDNYFNTTGRVTTVGLERSKDLARDFGLDPIPETPIVLPEILYDLAKWDLKPQYKDSLQGLITTLDENPTIKIELSSHTDYRDTEERNDILSQKRAQSVVDYLIERGIDPDRLVAKGYGERVPRNLDKDIVSYGFLFKKGTVLTPAYIDSLPTVDYREGAHALNRRTEFRVLSKDFVPKPKNVELSKSVEIRINPEDNVLAYTMVPKSGLITAPCVINGYTIQFVFDPKLRAQISVEEALKLLNQGAINKNDFKGNPEEILAGGTIANRAIFIVKDMTVANVTIHDVELMVNDNLGYTLVIGNSVLSSFGEYTVDSQKQQIIFKKKQ